MTKRLLIIAVILLVSLGNILCIFGCSTPESPTTQPTATTSAPEATTTEPEYTISFSSNLLPTNNRYVKALTVWANEVEANSNGRIKVELYHTETLLKAVDAYEGVIQGIADVSHGQHVITPGRFPLMSVMNLPFLCPTAEIGTQILNDLYNEFPEMHAEHDGVHVLAIECTTSTDVHTSTKAVRTLADLEGLKIGGSQGTAVQMENLGNVSVVMPATEFYTSVEKGVIDGIAMPWGALYAWKLHEVTKYHTNFSLGTTTQWAAMNINTWNNLPPELQAVIDDASSRLPTNGINAANEEGQMAIDAVLALGHEIIDLSPEELAKCRQATEPTNAAWVADMEADNLPGQAVLDRALELLEEYTQ